MLSLLCCSLLLTVHTLAIKGPNVVLILTDDQDITLGGMDQMPKTNELIVNKGLNFLNAFVSSPICCVSRASILSGRYVHNHHTINNTLTGNCSSKYWQQNIEPTCFAPYIQLNNYSTFYAGKYLNQYGSQKVGGTQHIPVGWSQWKGLVGNSKYYDYNISDNGANIHYGDNYTADYYTNIISQQGLQFLTNYNKNDNNGFLMVLATPASHAVFTPAPQYNYTNETSPRLPNFDYISNEHGQNTKHILLETLTKMSDQGIYYTDYIYSQRHGTLRSVDDMVQNITNKINEIGELDNTYFIYTSDHGYHSGEFGMGWDKRQLYESDIRIPFYVSGPNVQPKSVTNKIALNIDIAPTLIHLITGDVNQIPDHMDGQSLVPWILSNLTNNTVTENEQFLIEYYGSAGKWNKTSICADVYPATIDGWSNYCDSWNNTYRCIRNINRKQNQMNGTIYCQFQCYGPGKVEIECDDDTGAQKYGEYYELDQDYYELNNLMLSLNSTSKQYYEQTLDKFMSCQGQTSCNQLRQG